MSLRLISFGLISAVVLMSALPAFADGDDAVIQNNGQESVVTGNRNNAINTSEQSSDTDSRRRGNTGTSQRNSQMNDVQGNDNNAVNVNVQKSKHKRR